MAPPDPRWKRLSGIPASWRRAVPSLLVFALIELVMLRGVVLGGVFFDRDLHLLWEPTTEVFVRALAAGAWPVWNPYSAFGQPLLANPTSQVFYPPTWLNMIMPTWTYYRLFVLGHLFWAAVGTAVLARRLGLGRAGATVAGALWMTSGPLISLVNVWSHLSGAAWIPWAVWAVDRAVERRTARAIAAGSAACAAPLLAGSPEMALAGAVGGMLLGLRGMVELDRPLWSRTRLAMVAAVISVAAGSIVLAAAQLAPTIDLVSRSGRSQLVAGIQLYWSMHPWSVLEAVSPLGPSRLPIRMELRRILYEGREAYLPSLYLGASTVALALAALLGRKRPHRRALAGVGLGLVIVALGWHTPIGRVIASLPLLDMFRYPVKAMVPVALVLALLGGMGFEALRDEVGRPGWRRALIVSLLLLLALALAGASWLSLNRAGDWGSAVLQWTKGRSLASVMHAAGWQLAVSAGAAAACAAALILAPGSQRGRHVAAAFVALVAVADLVRAHEGLNPIAPVEFFEYRSPLLPLLHLHPGERLFVFDYATPGSSMRYLGHESAYVGRGASETPWLTALWFREYPTGAVPSVWGIETAFDRDAVSLQPTWTDTLFGLRAMTEGTPAQLRLLRMGSVGYVASLHRENFEDLVPRAELPGHFAEPIRLFEVPDRLPRATAVSGTRIAHGREALRILSGPDFDPAREVILPAGREQEPAPGFRGGCSRRTGLFDRVDLQCTLSHEGHVVLSDTWDPGWSATIDGKPAAVLRANFGFRAVATPAGSHRIEMIYRPRALLLGLGVSAVGWLAVLATLAGRGRSAPEGA